MKNLTPKQTLSLVARNITPLKTIPITREFFNGESIEFRGHTYQGYSNVSLGQDISLVEGDENYVSEEYFNKLARDAYQEIDGWVNRALTVLGAFNVVPNFTNIPEVSMDYLFQAWCSKIEHSIIAHPANFELKVTLTQNSGGRTTNIPGRENFKISDLLSMKTKELLLGSNIVGLLEDSWEAIILERNNYYTKEEIDTLISEGIVHIDTILPPEDSNWEPTEDWEPTDKKYVDGMDAYLQEQINGLIVGEIELQTKHIKLSNTELESITGLAEHQQGVNAETKIIVSQTRSKIKELEKRIGVPLQAYKTEYQSVAYEDGQVTINNYDTIGNGSTDSHGGLNTETGEYTIMLNTEGDLVTFSIQAAVSGRPQPNIVAGKLSLFRNGELFIHPVTGAPLETEFMLNTIAAKNVSINAFQLAVRAQGVDTDELKVGDVITVVVEQSEMNGQTNVPLKVSDVYFDMVFNRTLSGSSNVSKTTSTDEVAVVSPTTESLSGTALAQNKINSENVDKINENISSIENLVDDLASLATKSETDDLSLHAEIVQLKAYTDGRFDALVPNLSNETTLWEGNVMFGYTMYDPNAVEEYLFALEETINNFKYIRIEGDTVSSTSLSSSDSPVLTFETAPFRTNPIYADLVNPSDVVVLLSYPSLILSKDNDEDWLLPMTYVHPLKNTILIEKTALNIGAPLVNVTKIVGVSRLEETKEQEVEHD